MGSGCGRVWGCKSRWRLKASGVAGWCCGVWNGGDADAGGDGDGGHCGDDQTCAGFCGGGGDCCEVGVGMVVKRCYLACLLQVLEVQ